MAHTGLTSRSASSEMERMTSRTAVARSSIVLVLAALLSLALPQAARAADFAISTPAGTLYPGVVSISGDKDAAATVEVGPEGAAPTCSVPAGAEQWACELELPDGNHTIIATQSSADPVSVVSTASVMVRVLGAPVITTTGLTTGTVFGTGFPGAGIEISGDVGKSCGAVPANGAWSCDLAVGTGTYTIAATQTWGNVPSEPGGRSVPVLVRVDTDPPAGPAFAVPVPGSRVPSQPTTFSGTGESGGRVEVIVDGARACVSPVVNGSWACSATLADGDRAVHGIQWDAAGNSTAGAAFALTIGAAPLVPAAPPVEPPAEPAPAPEPAKPVTPALPAPSAPLLPPPVGGDSGRQPFDTWAVPTDYGAAIPSVTATNGASWLIGLVLALGFALLVALPLRLLVTTVRLKRGYTQRPARDEPPLLSPRVTVGLFLATAVLLAALAGGVQAEVRYLRLAIAIGLALAVLNGVGVLAAKLAGRAIGSGVGIRLTPLMLAIAAVTALVSRVGGIQPPIIVGIVLAARFAPGLGSRGRGIVSLAHVGSIVALGFAGWLGQSALGPVDGFLPSLVSEALSALCIGALGSAMVMLLPVHRMPGRLVWEFSRAAWVGLTLVTATLAGVVSAGGGGFPVPWVVGGAMLFAALSVAAWAWVRFIEPQFAVGGEP